ncbi:tumor necrosis factor ligand superfamily member 13B-like [Anguilla anguilla]|uniref:tumor necrosis factor ligand superfamily member 13B-like n=1 Tax=Anguilla anguilla TaxID=7936 RepID=UPI0015B0EFF4|nr:tumor necrosis factor ligand superfamily member 13B-like [Anguilla anguilla]
MPPMSAEEVSEGSPSPSPPASDCDCPPRNRGRSRRRRRGRRRSWALLALTLTVVAAACVSALSFHRVQALRSELSALRSEILRRWEEESDGAAQRDAEKAEDGHGELLRSSSGSEPRPSASSPKSQQVLQACLQMTGDSSRRTTQRGSYTALPWQAGLRQGTALQEEENAILVREGGFYFVYSQVYYTDKTFAMGHILQRRQRVVGDQPQEVILFRCIQNMDRNHPYNTCYTGGIVRLEAGDRLELLIPRQYASVSLEGDATFFGAVRLA